MRLNDSSCSRNPLAWPLLLLPTLLAATPALAGDTVIVDTGQIQNYDDQGEIGPPAPGQPFHGQDAQYDGNQPSYTLSGDGLTVYDHVTGLTWVASPDTDGDGILESPEDKLSWWDAMAHPATLNAQSFGGYDDWRVPSIKELYSLIDFSGVDPSGYSGGTSGLIPFIDTDYFAFEYGNVSAGERIIDSQYWSSNEYVSTTMHGDHTVFGVNFADGRIKGYGTSLHGSDKVSFILCCRGNANYGTNSYTDNGDGTVTDAATGLMWMQGDSGTGMIWEDALSHAENLAFGETEEAQYLTLAAYEIGMVIALPKKGVPLSAVEKRLDGAHSREWMAAQEARKVTVHVPRVDFRCRTPLKPLLSRLGMPLAFDRDRADFSGIARTVPLCVDRLEHDVWIAIDEQGISAGALSTAVDYLGDRDESLEFIANRPFLFWIVHRETNCVLFLGRLVDPRDITEPR